MDIDADFDGYSSPVVYDCLNTLEGLGIVYSDIVFNQEENRTEKIFFAAKPMI